MATAFENFVNAELVKRIGYGTTPGGGNSTAGTIPVFTGTGLTIAEQAQGLLTAALATTGLYSGLTSVETVGENVVFGDQLYLKSDGKYWKALGTNAAATYPVVVMATGTATANNTVVLLHVGFARLDSWAFSVGSLFLSPSTAGVLTQTQPVTSGNIVQVVGYTRTSNIIFFNPNQVWIELA